MKKWSHILPLFAVTLCASIHAQSFDAIQNKIFLTSRYQTLLDEVLLNKRQAADLELLLVNGFAPLEGFMNQNDYDNVVENMRLADSTVWPMPITLDVPESTVKKLQHTRRLALRSPDGPILAYLEVEDVWKPNKLKEAELVYGTQSMDHPGVAYLLQNTHEYYVGGKVTQVALPTHYDFNELRKTPQQLKQYFKHKGYDKVVAFQTRNPMHRAHVELTQRAMKATQAHLLIQPVVGLTKPGDIDHFTRVKCYKEILHYYPQDTVTLSLLPLAMRMAGPREALWHAIIRKNYGCTHFIVGRDHAGPGKDNQGKDFYGPYDAQALTKKYASEIGMTILPYQEMVYLPDQDRYVPIDEVPENNSFLTISGTKLRNLLNSGDEIPAWFSYPEVIKTLQKSHPPRNQQGLTLFFTGLPGGGKSTLSNALAMVLNELQDKNITILDGDELRTNLSSELGFSKEHRSIHVRRVGFVAREITKHRGIAMCALVSPYEVDRSHVKKMIESEGAFIEIYISTPLDVCEDRDIKGHYAKAREGIIPEFTGISDPYDIPKNPDVVIDTSVMTTQQAVDKIINYLFEQRYL